MSNSRPTAASTRSSWLTRGLAVGAAAAASLALTAGFAPAEAGTDAEWNRLAQCESGQNWSINTGNGYYGGLQFAKGSWDWAGGERYAAYPHQATREEQIAIAERLLDMQHISRAWPACSAAVGLTHDELQSGSATPPGGSAPAPAPEPEPEPEPEPAPAPTSGSYTVVSGDTLSRIADKLDVSGGWEALYRANTDKISNPNVIYVGQVLAVPGGSDAPAPAPSSASYTVRSGDTLSSIARAESVSGGWEALYRANTDKISNPNLIYVGQVLDLP